MPELAVRVDGSSTIGFGHAVRCLALVQAWIDRGETASVVTAELPDAVRQNLLDEQVNVIDLPHPDAITDRFHKALEEADWTVFDSYSIATGIRDLAQQHGSRSLLIDDFATSVRPVEVDLLVDQNFGTNAEIYAADQVSKFALGPRFALLRRFFRLSKAPPRNVTTRQLNVLVSLGGSSRPAVASSMRKLIRTLNRLGHRVTTVGADFGTSLRDFNHLPQTILETDLAVTATGTTTWELLWAGVPIVAIPIASNQTSIALHLEEAGAAVFLDSSRPGFGPILESTTTALAADPAQRLRLSLAGRGFVDGHGAERVVRMMLKDTS